MGTNGTGCAEWERDFDPATEQPHPVYAGADLMLGVLPAGCTVLDMRTGLIGKHALVLIATDQGVFIAEVGKSRLTKLEAIVDPVSVPQ